MRPNWPSRLAASSRARSRWRTPRSGYIDGKLTARGALLVRATGKVLGIVRCRRLQVEDGGQITGHIEMLASDQARSEPAPRPLNGRAD